MCYQTESESVIKVSDSGASISQELLPKIFDVFVQGPMTIHPSKGGLGRVLALVKELTSLHGGTVEVVSEGPGHESYFTLGFPCIATSVRDVKN